MRSAESSGSNGVSGDDVGAPPVPASASVTVPPESRQAHDVPDTPCASHASTSVSGVPLTTSESDRSFGVVDPATRSNVGVTTPPPPASAESSYDGVKAASFSKSGSLKGLGVETTPFCQGLKEWSCAEASAISNIKPRIIEPRVLQEHQCLMKKLPYKHNECHHNEIDGTVHEEQRFQC